MGRIEVIWDDLLAQDVDAIVNPANTHMAHGGGLAGKIARAGGPAIDRESRTQRPVPTGAAIVTTAGKLPQKWVIHAVGPIWRDGSYEEDILLAHAHRSILVEADRIGAKSVAIPAISCGIFHFPVERAAPIAMTTIETVLPDYPGIELVRFVLFEETHYDAYCNARAQAVRQG